MTTTPKKVGPFILEKRLGAGAMGVVFRARHVPTGKIVAVKLFPPSMLENEALVARFRREMKVLRQLRHPNIVRCYGGSPKPPQPYFAMEYVTGGTLAGLIRRKGRLPWEEVIHFGVQICRALDCAHRHGVVHRDLKPSNLLLTDKGQLKLSDFGLAKGQDATMLTQPGKTVGTYAYMAPEQITGKHSLSAKTDLYALGCVLYEMLVGEPPFVSDSAAEVLYKHIQERPVPPIQRAVDCPIWLDAIVMHLLQKDPAARPLDAVMVEQALLQAREKALERTAATAVTEGRPLSAAVPAAAGATAVPASRAQATAGPLPARTKKKKKRKRTEDRSLWERPAVLVGALALLVTFVVWMMQPPSEHELYERARVAMASKDEYQMYEALEDYMLPYVERFPDGEHIDEIRAWIDQVEMIKAENRFLRNVRLGREPRSEAERLYREAWNYEQFGDPVTALERYRAMVELLKDEQDARPFVNLARRRIRQLEETAGKTDRVALVLRKLAQADELYRNGRIIEAQKIWHSIVNLYGRLRDMKPYVQVALDRLSGEHPPEGEPHGDGSAQPQHAPQPSQQSDDAPSGTGSSQPERPSEQIGTDQP